MQEPRKQSLQELSQQFAKLVAKVTEDPKTKARVTAIVEATRNKLAAALRQATARLKARK
jgi:hypothetical protein